MLIPLLLSSVSTTDRAVMSRPVVGADPPVGLNEAIPHTPGSGVDRRTVGREGPAGGHVDLGQRGQVGYSSGLAHLRPLHSLLSISQCNRDFDMMASQMQDEVSYLAQDRGQSKPSHPGGESTQLTQTCLSNKYPRETGICLKITLRTRVPTSLSTPSAPRDHVCLKWTSYHSHSWMAKGLCTPHLDQVSHSGYRS